MTRRGGRAGRPWGDRFVGARPSPAPSGRDRRVGRPSGDGPVPAALTRPARRLGIAPLFRRCAVVAGLVVGLLVPAGVATAAPAPVPLTPCRVEGLAAQCGTLRVPLDYTDPSAPTIAIGFAWRAAPHPSGRTVLAQEGGPGYPATGTASDFAAIFGGLLRTRNLLVVDARGTGRSTPLDCEPLQSLPSPSPRFRSAVTACGQQLNHTWRRGDGSWVHASDLFSTANTARDTARVVEALGVGPVDLYGDSYGTYFAQSFLARFPHLLRSVVLDSAYEARDLDPWYRTTVTTARAAFDTVCARAVGCPAGSSWARISALAASVRRRPVSGVAVGTDDRRHHATVGVTQLVDLVNDAGYDFDPYRQLDAAARAYLDDGDGTPLLRLWLQDVGYDYSDYSAPAGYYSDGLYLAVACTDYPQLFDLAAPPAQRRAQLAASIAALPADTFAPFTTREWLSVLPYTETYTGCLTWPAPTHAADPPVPPGPMDATGVPVLILNGELDSLTPAAGGAHIAAQIGPAAHAYVAANTVHLVALASPYSCGPAVVRRFVADPSGPLDTSCLARLPAVRAVPAFPRRLAGAGPDRVHRLATVAAAAAGDATVRFAYVDGFADRGLRGGSVTYARNGNARLSGVRWTVDSAVSGSVRATASGHRASLVVTDAAGSVPVTVVWGDGRYASVTVAGQRIRVPAP